MSLATRNLSLVFLLIVACKEKASEPGPPAEQVADHAAVPSSPYTARAASHCQACHGAIAREWSGSMHGNSTTEKDPLFALMFKKAQAVAGEQAKLDCNSCHNPTWQADAPTQLASAEGVTCVVCHQVADDHPKGLLASGQSASLDPTRAADGLAQALCLSCHDERKTSAGIPICVTGSENQHTGAAKCVDCHMAMTPGPASMGSKNAMHRSHAFPGGHDAAWVADAASLELHIDKKTKEVVATIKPGALGHSLPTGTPMRYIILELVAKNTAGEVVWRNRPEGAPLLQERDSIFMRAFQNVEGKAPVPPFASSGEPTDNRLQSATPHALRYALPAGASVISATLRYHLAPAPVLEEAGAPPHWREPVEMGRAEIQIP